MFRTSDVKKISQIFMKSLGLSQNSLFIDGVEILPIFHTARINEKNPVILKSSLEKSVVIQRLSESVFLNNLRDKKNHSEELLKKFVIGIKEDFKVDSYLSFEDNEQDFFDGLLPQSGKDSKRPLVVFSNKRESYDLRQCETLSDMDHPALWIHEGSSLDISFLEAFFAIRPCIQMEVELNRFETLDVFGNYMIGMVRF